MSILRIVGVLHHGEFLDGVLDRYVGNIVGAHLRVIGGAVQQEFVVFLQTAVHHPIGDRTVIERPLPDGGSTEGDPGRRETQHERIAARIQGQVRNVLGVDQAAAVRGLRVQQGG